MLNTANMKLAEGNIYDGEIFGIETAVMFTLAFKHS